MEARVEYSINSQAGLDNTAMFHYNKLAIGVWRSLVSRLVRVQEASGSNPDTPTKNPESAFAGSGFLIVFGFERPLRKHAGGMFLGRGRILWFLDASLADVDRNQTSPKASGNPAPVVNLNN